MRRGNTLILFFCALGCGADDSIDPGDLELRDLLGIDPAVAAQWTPRERASARNVLQAALEKSGQLEWQAPLPAAADVATQIAMTVDESQVAVGLAKVVVELDTARVRPL